ncbi:MAG: amidohydrolase family protein [Planctomycetota bacterium]|jgi:predicted TIM-barrel fold metal-dependent hydrolase|nr:amidohydrolase family protein [Planctomycetota bacterium]
MSTILENWQAGLGFPNVLAIDGHIHVHDWPHGANFNSVDEMAEGAVAYMDANGIDGCCVLSGGYMGSGCDYTVGNDILIELVGRLPDRLIGFLSVNPNDREQNILAELKRVEQAGIRCIKLLNSYQQSYPGDGPNLMALYRFASDHNMPVINHHWPADILLRIAEEFPTVDFIMAHYGGGAYDLLNARPNIHANIWGLGALGFLEKAVQTIGPDKFMFGSDGFMNPVSVGIGPVVYADITDEDKRKILGLNVARILDKAGALPQELKEKLNTK